MKELIGLMDETVNQLSNARTEIDRLTAEIGQAQMVCDSYAKENQQFSDRIDMLRAALVQTSEVLSLWLCHQYGQQEQYIKLRQANDAIKAALNEETK